MQWNCFLTTLLFSFASNAQPGMQASTELPPPEKLVRYNPSVTIPVCEYPSVCVPKEDMHIFIKLLHEKKCQLETVPKVELDPIQIVVDKRGRIFFSGSYPNPYRLRLNWCSYQVEAEGTVDVVAAMRKPPLWGLRFRPKAYMGLLPSELLYPNDSRQFRDLVDVGFLIDTFYYDWINLNAAVGIRSLGLGLGFDITENFGLYSGYAFTWGSWNHGANISLWFSFWN